MYLKQNVYNSHLLSIVVELIVMCNNISPSSGYRRHCFLEKVKIVLQIQCIGYPQSRQMSRPIPHYKLWVYLDLPYIYLFTDCWSASHPQYITHSVIGDEMSEVFKSYSYPFYIQHFFTLTSPPLHSHFDISNSIDLEPISNKPYPLNMAALSSDSIYHILKRHTNIEIMCLVVSHVWRV